MMHNDSSAILDDLLSRWHSYCRTYNSSERSCSPMFQSALRAKGEQTLDAISEDAWYGGTMKAIDFQVGEMQDPHRTAIYVHARNCYTGRSVWMSPRLPRDPMERQVILSEAKAEITRRLISAGVM